MRHSDPPVYYLVGTPKGKLSQLEQKLLALPFTLVRSGVEVKLLAQEQELYVLAKSHQRIDKERAMRRRQLRALLKRLKELNEMKFHSSQRSEEHTSELQSQSNLVCRLLLEKKKKLLI